MSAPKLPKPKRLPTASGLDEPRKRQRTADIDKSSQTRNDAQQLTIAKPVLKRKFRYPRSHKLAAASSSRPTETSSSPLTLDTSTHTKHIPTPPPTEYDSASETRTTSPSLSFSENVSLADQLAKLTEEKDDYQTLYRQSQKECQGLKGTILLLEANQADDKEKLHEVKVEAENTTLRQQLAKVRENSKPQAALQQQWLVEKERLEKQIADLKDTVRTESKEAVQLLLKIGRLEETLRSQRQEMQYQTSALDKSHNETFEAYEEIGKLKKDYEQKMIELNQIQKLKADLDQDNEVIRYQLDESARLQSEHNVELAAMKKERADLLAQIQAGRKEHGEKMMHCDADIKKLTDDQREQVTLVKSLSDRLSQAKDLKSKAVAKVGELEKGLDSKIDEHERLRRHYGEMTKEKTQLLAEIKEVRCQLAEEKRSSAKAKTEFTVQIKEARRQLDEERRSSEGLAIKIEEISTEVAERKSEVQILKDLLGNAIDDAEIQTKKSTRLASQLQSCYEAQGDLEKEIKVCRKELMEEQLISGRQNVMLVRTEASRDWKDLVRLYGKKADISEKLWDRWVYASLQGHRKGLLEALKVGNTMEEALGEAERLIA